MIKNKKLGLGLVSALFLMVVALFVFSNFGIQSAYALTTPLYTVPYSYTLYRGGTAAAASIVAQSESDVYQSSKLYCNEDTYQYLYFQVYGNSYSGTANYTSSNYLGATVNIKSNSEFSTHSYTVTNSSGSTIATSTSQNFTMYSLSDGTYTVSYVGGSSWKVDGGIRDHPMGLRVECSFQFRVDTTAPTISGASTSTTGKYTNSAFTVTASDSASGVSGIYWKEPSASSYSFISSSSKTISAGSLNGLYCFYAVDNVGNTTSTYYVNYDNTKPTGAIKNSSGTTISGYTNGSFYYTATDNASGISYYQYQTAGSSTWQTYTSGTTISSSATNGTYSFRSVDKCGNISNTSSIILDTGVPTLTLYSGSTAVSSGYKSTASNIKAVASDSVSGLKNIYVKTPGASSYSTYTSSTTMSTNGTYYFYAVDNAGNTTSTVSISLDNTKPTITSSVTGSTISQAFTITATDNIGTPTLYFKKPGASSYSQSSSNSMTIPITSADGTYSFYAVDGYGNVSDTYSVNFYVAPPTATIVRPTNGNIACVVWSDSNCSATLNGNYYNSGTWIIAEGNYTFTLINEANRTTTLEFSIDHYYVASNSVSPTCTEQGYTIYKCQNCGDTYNADFVSALGHTYVTSVVAPTCTEEGYTLHTCTRCGYSYKDNYTDMLGHTYGNWYTVTSPTCTATGVSRRDCKDCTHYETRTDNALGHNYTSTITAPTCTAQGYTTHTCTRCTSSYTDTYVAALGHSYKEVVTKPTCTQRGYTTHTCSRCNTSYVDSYTEATGHSMKDWYTTKAATCTATGTAKRDCSKCDYSETKILPVLGHDYIETVTAPTCTERGYSTFVCSRCKDTYIDNWVNELGHDYKEEVIAPTCLEEGYTLHKCVRCGDSYKTDAVTMLGHNYIEDYVTATCEEAGYLLHTCLRCGEEYRSEIVNPSGHDYETNIVLTASCAEDGERYFHCVKCGETHYETIPARGHDYTIVDSEHEDGVVYRTYTCSICGYAYDMKIGEEYEQISNYIEYLFDQYSPYMVWVFLATAGVWSIAMGVALIIAKKNEDQAKAKRMIVNYVIGLVTIFIILVAAPYLVRGIALLISS